ncbi:putative G2 mitotic-specific cyclin [Clavispora lusitaniae]|nr:G2/mitotic-specific cyclin [Clavispora lusitaniae]KAF7582843.1 Cyclin, N-terminal domain family protein [Clavispora lusitaniae]OVF11396.1 putative G2/mitotic-specific cyclin [Clavispora lusitaniae]QFZ28065.1 putative G2 mitotic-specific cyclin [Clavispora lusitaniae]QFZ33728.1 putative G2 mitotic-specific cyclin [Clavispora lusitaniae]
MSSLNNENVHRMSRSRAKSAQPPAPEPPQAEDVLVQSTTAPKPQRRHLGDVSRQFGIATDSQHAQRPAAVPSSRKRAPETEKPGETVPRPLSRTDTFARPQAPLLGDPLGDSLVRLPQKRQATESSTNLVEKLHVSENHKKSRREDYQWQDLDEEDADDPLMVSEYVGEIFPYLHELERKTLPDANYLYKQTQLKPRMRSILVDWLVEMHQRFRLLPETLFLAINTMDRFMSVEVVQIDKLQLLATGSLFIAAKYEEVFSPSVKNYAYYTDGSYTEDEILQAEKYILTILDFDLNYPNPMNFLRRISKADDYDVQSRTLGKFLLEITVVDYRFIGMLPSLCSAAAMYIARLALGKDPVWNGNLIHYSGGYRVEDMKECIELIVQYLVSPVEHDEFFKKYATRKFMKASIFCRSWAKKFVAEKKDLFDESLLTENASK